MDTCTLATATALWASESTAARPRPGDLPFLKGDVIEVLSQEVPGGGWWTGQLQCGGVRGIFPANLVKLRAGASGGDGVAAPALSRLAAAAAWRMAVEWAATEQHVALRLARLRLALCCALEWSGIVIATVGTDVMRVVAEELEAQCAPPWERRRELGLGFNASDDSDECAHHEAHPITQLATRLSRSWRMDHPPGFRARRVLGEYRRAHGEYGHDCAGGLAWPLTWECRHAQPRVPFPCYYC